MLIKIEKLNGFKDVRLFEYETIEFALFQPECQTFSDGDIFDLLDVFLRRTPWIIGGCRLYGPFWTHGGNFYIINH